MCCILIFIIFFSLIYRGIKWSYQQFLNVESLLITCENTRQEHQELCEKMKKINKALDENEAQIMKELDIRFEQKEARLLMCCVCSGIIG